MGYSAVKLFKGTSFKGNQVQPTKSSSCRRYLEPFSVAKDCEDLIVCCDHTGDALGHILRVQVLKVDLHAGLQVQKKLVLVCRECTSRELLN